MAGKKGGKPGPDNTLLSGAVIFILFLVGVWLFATPQTPPGSHVPIHKFETETAPEIKHHVADVTEIEDVKDSEEPPAAKEKPKKKEEKVEKEEKKEEKKEKKEKVESFDAAATTKGVETYAFPLCPDTPADHIPCLDNEKAIKALKSTAHYEHRERHCPAKEEVLQCLLPLPKDYKPHITWPQSRDEVWFNNVPHPSLANYKADQNWVKAEGDKFVFPGGGTQFKFGATKYIEWLEESVPVLTWGTKIRVGLDMGCGVASFAAYLEPFKTRFMSVAPKDEHDAQIQFALERGVSAIVGVMGTQRQPYPANVFDAVHCARCRVPWHAEGGKLLLELNRLIRPGGYFVWSATPVCPECKAFEPDDKEVWEAMSDLTAKICWTRVAKKISMSFGIGVAVWQKPVDNKCYEERPEGTIPPMCAEDDNADAAWYVPMQACLHKVPTAETQRGVGWPTEGVERLTTAPAWLKSMKKGVYGKPAYEEFKEDVKHWANVAKSYSNGLGIDWSTVRNIMDMDAHYGGFAASIADKESWTMNVVPTTSPDTLGVIFDRGLLGIYHDWCESFNTYPRTYDLLHADHLLGHEIKNNRCDIQNIMLEMDRILRPTGYVIIREKMEFVPVIEAISKGLHWELIKSFKEDKEALLAYQKTLWRPS